MRRIIFTFLIFIFLALPAFSAQYMPKYLGNLPNCGIGLYFGTGKATVYEAPDTNSPVIANIHWDTENVYINNEKFEPKNIFAVFLPQKALSAFIAVDEQGEEYTKIIYNNSKQLTGWIKNDENAKAFYWRQLFYRYGKTNGLYLFADFPKDKKNLMLTPEEDANVSYQFIYPKYIRLQLIKGNWALIKVVDYDDEQKIGWFQWRNSNGSLNLFPQFNE